VISLRLPAADDVAELVEALLAAADTRDTTAPTQAARWRDLANDLGDALEHLPQPIPFREDPTA
jgi:hypothetical protein